MYINFTGEVYFPFLDPLGVKRYKIRRKTPKEWDEVFPVSVAAVDGVQAQIEAKKVLRALRESQEDEFELFERAGGDDGGGLLPAGKLQRLLATIGSIREKSLQKKTLES